MKYNIGGLIEWRYPKGEISTILDSFYDWDGKTMYTLLTYYVNSKEYNKEPMREEEIENFIKDKQAVYYPVIK